MHFTDTLKQRFSAWISAFALLFTAGFFDVHAQDVSREATTIGTVVAINRNSVSVKTPDVKYFVFMVDKNTTKPANLAVGSQVKVVWSPTEDPDVRLADNIIIIPPGATADTVQQAEVPVEIRNVEKAIEKDFRHFRLGFQGGFGLDPELADIGMHMQMGPIFSENLWFRPSFDFGWGEVTTLFALNPDFIFRVPFGPRGRRWMYVGGGPGFNFAEKSFGASNVNFSDFNYSTSLNLLAGMQWRTGMYTELRTAVFAKETTPVVRFVVGYTF